MTTSHERQEDQMTPTTAPRGAVATIGHPANGTLIVKGRSFWRYVDTGLPVDPDDFRGGWEIVSTLNGSHEDDY